MCGECVFYLFQCGIDVGDDVVVFDEGEGGDLYVVCVEIVVVGFEGFFC